MNPQKNERKQTDERSSGNKQTPQQGHKSDKPQGKTAGGKTNGGKSASTGGGRS